MPVIWTSLGFSAGILSAERLEWGTLVWTAVLGVLIPVSLIYSRFSKPGDHSWLPRWGPPVLLISFCLGGLRYQLSLPDFEDPELVTHFLAQAYSAGVRGQVVSYPDKRDQTQNLQVKVTAVDPLGNGQFQPAQGMILARAAVELPIRYGDEVLLTGSLGLAPQGEDFDYRSYLARKGIYAYMGSAEVEVLAAGKGNPLMGAIYDLRALSLERIYRLWPDPEASLLAGILLGLESGISEEVQASFRETGTTHIIAISGFNITIVAGLFGKFFGRFLNRRQAALAALLGITLYTLLVGADPAVVRAAVMGGFSILAHQIGRRQHGLNAAALASLVMVGITPGLLWDVGFQLSLAATLGLILYADPLASWFTGEAARFFPREAAERIARPVSEYFLFTLAAQLTTLPVMLYHFGIFSPITFLANPAILPVQPPIMILGGLALILGMIWLPAGQAAAPLVYPFVLYTIRIVEWFSRLPLPSVRIGEISLGWIAAFYLLLGTLTFGKELLVPLAGFLTPSAVGAGLALSALLVWRAVFCLPDGRLHLFLLDVGTGSAMYLVSPSGQRMLINGGPSTRLLSDHLGRRLPPFNRTLDLALIASPQQEDLDSLAEALLRFPPDTVLWLGDPGSCWEAENLRAGLDEQGIEIHYGAPGETLVFQDGLQVEILSANRGGGSLLVEYGSFRALLPFSLREEDRQGWRQGRELGRMSVYYLADHGYQSSNPTDWIENLQPELVLLSVGIEDSRGLPDRGLISRLGGYSLLRTDQHGTVELISDGTRLWIRVESAGGL